MSIDSLDGRVAVRILDAGLRALLTLQPGIDPAALGESALAAIVQGAGVVPHTDISAALRDIIIDYTARPAQPIEREIAVGTPPLHGTNGRVAFEPAHDPALRSCRAHADADNADAAPASDPAPEPGSADAQDHYSRSSIVTVQPGELIATIIAPIMGVDGRDVHGGVLAAKPGRPARVATHDSIVIHPDGRITAARAGLVEARPPMIRVSSTLRIPGSVDFSTGHVQFPGNIEVAGGVRDRFRVAALNAGGIRIAQLVEAAVISAQRDVIAAGGIAAKDQGEVRAGRDAEALYLNGALVLAARDLRVANEIVSSRVTVGRSLDAPLCSVTGGELTIAAAGVVGTLGCEAGTPTLVRLASLPEIERQIERLDEVLPKLRERANAAQTALDQLKTGGKLSARQAEELTEREFALSEANARLAPAVATRTRLRTLLHQRTTLDLTVNSRLYAGAKLLTPVAEVTFTKELRGPVRFTLEALDAATPARRSLVAREENNAQPIDLASCATIVPIEPADDEPIALANMAIGDDGVAKAA